MAGTEGCQVARRSQSQKTGPSSDRSLQLDSLKPDLLVIGDQNAPVNTFSDLVLTIKAPSSFLFKRVKISSSDSSSERSWKVVAFREERGEGPGNKMQSNVSRHVGKVVSTSEQVVSRRKIHAKACWNVWNGIINNLGRSGAVMILCYNKII